MIFVNESMAVNFFDYSSRIGFCRGFCINGKRTIAAESACLASQLGIMQSMLSLYVVSKSKAYIEMKVKMKNLGA